jgi:hypothetical protein
MRAEFVHALVQAVACFRVSPIGCDPTTRYDMSAWFRGRRAPARIVKNNKKTMPRSPGPSKSLARRPNDMQSLHGRPPLMMPTLQAIKNPARYPARAQFLNFYFTIDDSSVGSNNNSMHDVRFPAQR